MAEREISSDSPELALERIGRRRDMAEAVDGADRRNGDGFLYQWPATAMETVRRFYERTGDLQMERLIRHEIEHHRSIEQRLKEDYQRLRAEREQDAKEAS